VGRARLVSAARDCFAEQGYAGTSLRHVAARTGFTKASIFHHFPSKEELYLAVIGDVLGELGTLVLAAGMEQGDHVERLDRLGVLVVDYLGSHRGAARLLMREIIDKGPFYARDDGAAIHHTLAFVADFLADGMKCGVFATSDPYHLAVTIASLHLAWFAAADTSGALVGEDVFSADQLAARRLAIRGQVRALCGVAGEPASVSD